MVTKVIARYIRISPRKTRKVIGLIKGLPVVKAEAILSNLNKRPALYVKRLLGSAIDSADKKASISPADLYISLIKADGGPMLKRYRAASMGRATMIKHRTTHITIELNRIKRIEKETVKKDADAKKQGEEDTKKVKKGTKRKTIGRKKNKEGA